MRRQGASPDYLMLKRHLYDTTGFSVLFLSSPLWYLFHTSFHSWLSLGHTSSQSLVYFHWSLNSTWLHDITISMLIALCCSVFFGVGPYIGTWKKVWTSRDEWGLIINPQHTSFSQHRIPSVRCQVSTFLSRADRAVSFSAPCLS